jgi:hypothetical protein
VETHSCEAVVGVCGSNRAEKNVGLSKDCGGRVFDSVA